MIRYAAIPTAVLVLVLVATAATASATTGPVWIEKDGVIVMEAEKGTPESSDTWDVRTDVPDYRGDGFIRWMNSNHFSDQTHGVLSYRILVTNPGDYRFRWRAFHDPAAHGARGDQENDCWTNYKVNSKTAMHKTFRGGNNAGDPWNFATRWETSRHVFANPVLKLSAGEHVFRIAARSKNFMIDRLYLAKRVSDIGHDTPESEIRGGGGGGTANQEPDVSFARPTGGASFDAPADLGVTVSASDSDGTVEHVRLFIDGTLVRRENNSPYEWGTDNGGMADDPLMDLTAGTYRLKAVATDDDGATASATIDVTVRATLSRTHVMVLPAGTTADATPAHGTRSQSGSTTTFSGLEPGTTYRFELLSATAN